MFLVIADDALSRIVKLSRLLTEEYKSGADSILHNVSYDLRR